VREVGGSLLGRTRFVAIPRQNEKEAPPRLTTPPPAQAATRSAADIHKFRKLTVNGLIPLDSRGIVGLDRGRLTGNGQFGRRAITFFSTGPSLGPSLGPAFPPELHRLWSSTF